MLLQRREALQSAVQGGNDAASPVELDQTRVGRLSRMDALQGQAMSQETQRRREQELRRIAQALQRIEQGEFGTLLGWLQENIYQHGRKFTTSELVERVTGGPISIEPYIRYLERKYGELYDL